MPENVENKKTETVTVSKSKIQKPEEVKAFPPKKTPHQTRNANNQRPRRNRNQRNNWRDTEFEEKVVNISRVTNVVKGGRRFSFSTLVVIGDKKGRVAYGSGKAKEVPESIKKAIKSAKKNLVRVPIIDKRTIPHITQAKFISSNVLLKPAPRGKGIIASGAVRSVVELAGYHDIVTKSLGSSNKNNAVKATIKALSKLKTASEIASLRDKKIDHFE